MNIYILISVAFFSIIHGYASSYQIGSSWSRKHIHSASEKVRYLQSSVGEVGARATLFYIGQRNNKHWAVTNNHVCPGNKKNKCLNQWIVFFYHKNAQGEPLKGNIVDVPLSRPDLDFSLVEIKFKNLASFESLPFALSFSHSPPYHHQELISLGYGGWLNEYGSLTIEENSEDCKVFSYDDDIKLSSDPDSTAPLNHKVYSFIHGCDASHGDSGSPLLDEQSHEVIGLLWSGKYPKPKGISQDDFYLLPYEQLWNGLNYAVPAFMISDKIESFFAK